MGAVGVAGWRVNHAGAGLGPTPCRGFSRRELLGCAALAPMLLALAGCSVPGDSAGDAGTPGDGAPAPEAETSYPVRTSEAHGTRLATPYYSVLIDEDLFPSDWAYAYNPIAYSLAASSGSDAAGSSAPDAPQWSDELTVMQGGRVAFTVRCCTDDWSGVQGEAASVDVGAVPGKPGWKVVVAVGVDTGAADDAEALEQAQRQASVYSALVSLA